MALNGNRPGRKTGARSTPRLPETEREPFENQPRKLPPAPEAVAEAKLPRQVLLSRSLLSLAFRHVRPNWRHYVQYVEIAARQGDSAMQRFIECWRSLSDRERRSAWPEQICDFAAVTPAEVYGAVCRQMWETKAAESSMISSLAHPDMLLQTIRYAKREENFKDRELYFRMMGSLPDRKGASINIFNQAAGQIGGEAPTLGLSKLRSFDDEVIEMSRDLEMPFLVKGDEDA